MILDRIKRKMKRKSTANGGDSGVQAFTRSELMEIMDAWVKQHPWAQGGWVPGDKITSDYKTVLPNEELIVTNSPHPIQQVRDEIGGFIDVVLGLKKRDKILEIGMGIVGGSHALWTHIFPQVITVEFDINRVEKFFKEQKPNPLQSLFITGDSRGEFVIRQTMYVAQSVDVLFIDGDHTRFGVESDWRNYKDLVRPGGIIAFHDTILDGPPDIEVYSFLKELEGGKLTGQPEELHNIHHSKCVGISYYYVR